MKILYLILPVVIFFGCQSSGEKKMTDPTTETEESGIYGEKINAENPIAGTVLAQMLEEQDSVWVTCKSSIVANCQHSGCWMDLDMGEGKVVKVTFKDGAFTIPLDSKGKTAIVEGYAKKELIPVDLLKHYAEDDGKSQEQIDAITEPELAYTFEAIGVIIED